MRGARSEEVASADWTRIATPVITRTQIAATKATSSRRSGGGEVGEVGEVGEEREEKETDFEVEGEEVGRADLEEGGGGGAGEEEGSREGAREEKDGKGRDANGFAADLNRGANMIYTIIQTNFKKSFF